MAIVRLVQGDNRINMDMHHADFEAVEFPPAFHKAAKTDIVKLLIESKSVSDLLNTPAEPAIGIGLQDCDTSWPDEKTERRPTRAEPSKPILDSSNDAFGASMLSILNKPDFDSSGVKAATNTLIDLKEKFQAQAREVPHSLPTAGYIRILDPSLLNTENGALELGTKYSEANIFRRCTIHQSVIDLEIA